MLKRLIIIRHAHRDTADRALDNGLSKKGKKQARRLLAFYTRALPDARPLILTSPLKRCVETVEPLAAASGTRAVMDKRLLDLSGKENRQTRPKRLADFLSWWKEQAPGLTIACSHGDWIDLFLKMTTGVNGNLKKGGWAEIVWQGKQAELVWLIQSFKNLLP